MKRLITIILAIFIAVSISSCAPPTEPSVTPTDGGIGGTGKPIV